MINSGNGDAFERISRLVRDYLTRDQSGPQPPPPTPVSDLARRRAGWYRPDNPRVEGLHFVERVLGLTRVTAGDSGLVLKPLLGERVTYLPVSDRLFRKPSDPVATLALVDDSANGRDAAIEMMGYLLPASFHRAWTPAVWLEVGVTALFLLGALATILFGLVWVPRWLFRRLREVPALRVRAWPLLAVLSVAAFVIVVMFSMEDAIPRLGRPTAWAWTLMVCTTLFPVTAVAGLVSALRAPEGVKRGVRWLALVASAANVVVAAYVAWFGMIAWRSWS
jgi:hypothetical protein